MSATDTSPNQARIRQLNDLFRRTFVGGAVFLSAGVEAMDQDSKRRLLADVRAFDNFPPHTEHDYGALELNGEHFAFKLDYYDKRCKYASPDPSDPDVTTRVLTVMRGDEH